MNDLCSKFTCKNQISEITQMVSKIQFIWYSMCHPYRWALFKISHVWIGLQRGTVLGTQVFEKIGIGLSIKILDKKCLAIYHIPEFPEVPANAQNLTCRNPLIHWGPRFYLGAFSTKKWLGFSLKTKKWPVAIRSSMGRGARTMSGTTHG